MRVHWSLFWLVAAGIAIWKIMDRLSDDAIGVIVGLVFGVLALAPFLLVFALKRDGRSVDRGYDDGYRREPQGYAQMPPVIIFNQLPAQASYDQPQGYSRDFYNSRQLPVYQDSRQDEGW